MQYSPIQFDRQKQKLEQIRFPRSGLGKNAGMPPQCSEWQHPLEPDNGDPAFQERNPPPSEFRGRKSCGRNGLQADEELPKIHKKSREKYKGACRYGGHYGSRYGVVMMALW